VSYEGASAAKSLFGQFLPVATGGFQVGYR